MSLSTHAYSLSGIGILVNRLLTLFACALTISATHADPYPSPPALPPTDLATLQIRATPEHTNYLLGETVRVRYSVANHGSTPITIRRDNDSTYWHPESLKVTAIDTANDKPVPATPSGIDFMSRRYGRSHSIAPGETWSHDFFILRFVELPGPGRYRFKIRHDLGWPDKSTAPAAPEFILNFTAPTPAQAAALVAAAPPLSSPNDDTPPPIDTYGFNYPIYIAPLVQRIATGESALLASLDRMPIPAATAALITLSTNAHKSVAKAARYKLICRLPRQTVNTGNPTYTNAIWPYCVPAQNTAWTPAERISARALAHTLLHEELPQPDASGLIHSDESPALIAGVLLDHFGEASDLHALAEGLQNVAYQRTLDATAYHRRTWAGTFLGNEIESLRAAYAGMHARGIRTPLTSGDLGEAILSFDDSRLATQPADLSFLPDPVHRSIRTVGPRSAAWLDQLNLLANLRPWPGSPSSDERPGYLGDPATHRPPHPLLLIAALESIPTPLPPECIPFVKFAFESNVPHVIHAACAVAVETRSPLFIPDLLRVLQTEADPDVRTTVAKTIDQLGDHLTALHALVDDIATTPQPGQLLHVLAGLLFQEDSPSGNYTIPSLSRTERLALSEAWQTFLRENQTRLAQKSTFSPGDPIIPANLFAGAITWRLKNGTSWPAHTE